MRELTTPGAKLDYTEYESVVTLQGHVGAFSIACDWPLQRRLLEKVVHG